jgi:hypothetical protein
MSWTPMASPLLIAPVPTGPDVTYRTNHPTRQLELHRRYAPGGPIRRRGRCTARKGYRGYPMVIAIVREVPGSWKRCLATAFPLAARLATATAPRIPGVTLGLARFQQTPRPPWRRTW